MAINWKARAKKWEQEALTANENLVKVAFCLEKEKALRRRSDEQNQILQIKLNRAVTALYGATENFAGRGLRGSADLTGMIANDLRPFCMQAEGYALAPIAPKDEQH